MSATAKKGFGVGTISGTFVVLRTRKAKKDCSLRDCNLLKRNFMAELFMKHFLTFSKHFSNIVWSSNLAALQPVDGESLTLMKCKIFESFKIVQLLLKWKTYQCKWQNFWQRCRIQTFLLFSTRDLLQKWFQHRHSPFPSNFKNYSENSQETFTVDTVFGILMEDILEISNCLKETLLKTLF